MEKNTKIQEQQQAAVVTQTVQQQKQTAASALDKLREYGGFTFLENIIDGFSNLNPARKARRNIFLSDEQWANERKALVNRLGVWIDLLQSNESAEKMRDKAKDKALQVEELLNKNLHTVLDRTR